jgi:hypothetical protein
MSTKPDPSEPTVLRTYLDGTPIVTYIGVCCREWPLAVGFPVGRCGLCGERPVAKRVDEADE